MVGAPMMHQRVVRAGNGSLCMWSQRVWVGLGRSGLAQPCRVVLRLTLTLTLTLRTRVWVIWVWVGVGLSCSVVGRSYEVV